MRRRKFGLYWAEQQALAFIAEEQGVGSKALKQSHWSERMIQWGLHGRRRNGRLEFPGLLARGIVFVAGGHVKGGRAPGGAGLTPVYAVTRAALLRFNSEELSRMTGSGKGEPNAPWAPQARAEESEGREVEIL